MKPEKVTLSDGYEIEKISIDNGKTYHYKLIQDGMSVIPDLHQSNLRLEFIFNRILELEKKVAEWQQKAHEAQQNNAEPQIQSMPKLKKKFNLQRALAGDPVVTRDGQAVKIAGYNPNAKDTVQVLGWYGDHNYYTTWNANGRSLSDSRETSVDLFMASKEKTIWHKFICFRSFE